MAVLLADGLYQVSRQAHPLERDAHGTPVPGPGGPPTPLVPGAATRQLDGSWTMRLDSAVWPVAAGDVVERPADSGRWTVTGTPRNVKVPGAPDVDHVALTAAQDPPDVDRGYPTRE